MLRTYTPEALAQLNDKAEAATTAIDQRLREEQPLLERVRSQLERYFAGVPIKQPILRSPAMGFRLIVAGDPPATLSLRPSWRHGAESVNSSTLCVELTVQRVPTLGNQKREIVSSNALENSTPEPVAP
jgi:hypothetical protein